MLPLKDFRSTWRNGHWNDSVEFILWISCLLTWSGCLFCLLQPQRTAQNRYWDWEAAGEDGCSVSPGNQACLVGPPRLPLRGRPAVQSQLLHWNEDRPWLRLQGLYSWILFLYKNLLISSSWDGPRALRLQTILPVLHLRRLSSISFTGRAYSTHHKKKFSGCLTLECLDIASLWKNQKPHR